MVISIIVPVYNIEEYIARCLQSIIKQTYREIEIIVVDDGSTDLSGEICDSFAEQDDRIYVIHKENGGLVSARKVGAMHVTGDYVLNIDGDDWIEEDYVEGFAIRINRSQEDMICAIGYYKDYENHSVVYCSDRYRDKDIQSDDIQKELLDNIKGKNGYLADIEYSLWLECIKTNLYVPIQNTIDNRISYNEDAACVVRCLSKTDKVGFIRNIGYHYCVRSTSIVYSTSSVHMNAIKLAFESTTQYIEGAKEQKSLQNILEGVYVRARLNCDFLGMQEDKNYLAPFKKITLGSKVVVYGMGAFGKKMVSYIRSNDKFCLVAWTDSKLKLHEQISKKCEIIVPEDINNVDYDYVVIASIKSVFIDQIKKRLISLGIPEEKIVHV